MANLQERRDKKTGKLLSYSIRVYRGRGADGKQLKPYTATFDVSPSWSEKTAKKKAEAFAATFEKECKDGIVSDSRQTFAQYADYVLSLKERRGDKHTTITDYRNMTVKTASSKRYISIPVEATSLLKKYKAWQSSEIIRLGEYYQRNDYVFSQDNGSRCIPIALRHGYIASAKGTVCLISILTH